MINFEIFTLGLLVTSTLTGVVTEAVKKILTEHNRGYYSNTLAGIIATILSAAIGIGYTIVTNSGFTSQTIVYIIAMIFMSWLCAMIGYDKVMQAIGQFKTKGKDDNDE